MVFANLTALDNLMLGAYLRHDPKAIKSDLDRVYELVSKAPRARRSDGRILSGGEQQMLTIAAA